MSSDEPDECPLCGKAFASPPRCRGCGATLERLTPDGPVQYVSQRKLDELLRLQKRLDEEEV